MDLYRDGYGVKQNYKKAVYWYQQASNRDCKYAKLSVRALYEDGMIS